MQRLGYIRVHSTLPVYTHPEKPGCQFSLTHRFSDTNLGEWMFETIEDESVTLEQDLACRDFTVNAIAKCVETGEIIDPFNGLDDIKNKILRPINERIFYHDPVRPYRMARFYSEWRDWSLWTDDQLVYERMSVIHDGRHRDRIVMNTMRVIESGGDIRRYVDVIVKLVPMFHDRSSDELSEFGDQYILRPKAIDLINSDGLSVEMKTALLKITFPLTVPGDSNRMGRLTIMMEKLLTLLIYCDSKDYDMRILEGNCRGLALWSVLRYFITPRSSEKDMMINSLGTLLCILKRQYGDDPISPAMFNDFTKKFKKLGNDFENYSCLISFNSPNYYIQLDKYMSVLLYKDGIWQDKPLFEIVEEYILKTISK
jgi:hypothetical protein